MSIVELGSFTRLQRFDGLHATPIYSVVWSPDSSTLLVGAQDKTASLVTVATGERVQHLTSADGFDMHADWLLTVALSGDGKYAALGSWDKTVSIVDVATGKRTKHLKDLRSGGVYSVAFCPLPAAE